MAKGKGTELDNPKRTKAPQKEYTPEEIAFQEKKRKDAAEQKKMAGQVSKSKGPLKTASHGISGSGKIGVSTGS
ncbi:hypothetical protein GJ744_003869 [Endocarpon pusillum]|uniref:Translation machinery-associated protein 7 n=1 Tax=Endocarpon pusillum TaxID=364733 RepID=A0A8H7E9G6_9EURO|nr:hypothetical protein GJ744_003869 [Endocarpon pusillum]